MANKTIVDYPKYVDGTSMGASIDCPSTNIMYVDRVGYQISYTGTPTGTFSVEISNDNATWEAMTLSTAIAAAGSPDNHFIDCETAAKYIRLKYIRSSGTGALYVALTTKSISG